MEEKIRSGNCTEQRFGSDCHTIKDSYSVFPNNRSKAFGAKKYHLQIGRKHFGDPHLMSMSHFLWMQRPVPNQLVIGLPIIFFVQIVWMVISWFLKTLSSCVDLQGKLWDWLEFSVCKTPHRCLGVAPETILWGTKLSFARQEFLHSTKGYHLILSNSIWCFTSKLTCDFLWAEFQEKLPNPTEILEDAINVEGTLWENHISLHGQLQV